MKRNNSDVKIMLREAGILFAITLLAGLILGFVYELTKEPIRRQEEEAVQEACAAVFAEAAGFDEITYSPDADVTARLEETGVEIGTVYEAKGADGGLLGYVVESTSTEGYGGSIVLYVGISLDGTVNDISILEISETAGLGMRAEEVLAPQFHEKRAAEFTYTKSGASSDSEIDAISGATITTRAVTNAVNGSLLVYGQLSQGGGGDE